MIAPEEEGSLVVRWLFRWPRTHRPTTGSGGDGVRRAGRWTPAQPWSARGARGAFEATGGLMAEGARFRYAATITTASRTRLVPKAAAGARCSPARNTPRKSATTGLTY